MILLLTFTLYILSQVTHLCIICVRTWVLREKKCFQIEFTYNEILFLGVEEEGEGGVGHACMHPICKCTLLIGFAQLLG